MFSAQKIVGTSINKTMDEIMKGAQCLCGFEHSTKLNLIPHAVITSIDL